MSEQDRTVVQMLREEGFDYLTIHEVAEVAKQSSVTIRRHIAKGALRSVKVGGSVRIPVDDARRYLGGSE